MNWALASTCADSMSIIYIRLQAPCFSSLRLLWVSGWCVMSVLKRNVCFDEILITFKFFCFGFQLLSSSALLEVFRSDICSFSRLLPSFRYLFCCKFLLIMTKKNCHLMYVEIKRLIKNGELTSSGGCRLVRCCVPASGDLWLKQEQQLAPISFFGDS